MSQHKIFSPGEVIDRPVFINRDGYINDYSFLEDLGVGSHFTILEGDSSFSSIKVNGQLIERRTIEFKSDHPDDNYTLVLNEDWKNGSIYDSKGELM